MDLEISRWVIKVFGENKAFAKFMEILTYGGSKWVIIGLVLLLLVFKRTREIGVTALFAVLFTYLFNDFCLKLIVARDRPFVVDSSLGQMVNLAGMEFPDGYSMASGHAAVTMAFAVAVMMHSWKLGIPSMIYSIAVGVSRIFLCVHFFTDVLAGFALGTVIAIIVFFTIFLIKKLYIRRLTSGKVGSSVSKQTQDQGSSGDSDGL